MSSQQMKTKPSFRRGRTPVTYEPAPKVIYDVEKIVALRRSLNMSQKEFATTLGVTERAVAQWEMDKAAPSQPIQNLMHALSLDKNLVFQFVNVIRKEKP